MVRADFAAVDRPRGVDAAARVRRDEFVLLLVVCGVVQLATKLLLCLPVSFCADVNAGHIGKLLLLVMPSATVVFSVMPPPPLVLRDVS